MITAANRLLTRLAASPSPTLSYVSSNWADRQAGDLVFFRSTNGSTPSGWSIVVDDYFSGSAGGGDTYTVRLSAGFRVLTGSDNQPSSAQFRIFRYDLDATANASSTASPADLTALPEFSGVFTFRYSEGAGFGTPAPSAPTCGGDTADVEFTFSSTGSGNGSYQMYGRFDIWLALDPGSYAISSVNNRYTIQPA
jgi:hypothetical protein